MKCPHCGKEIIPLSKQALDRYYQSRDAGFKVTLKRVAQEFELNYSYLSNAKIKYDKKYRQKVTI
jgi:hypothetical protein